MSINEGSDHRLSCWPSRPEIHFLVSRAYQVSQHFFPRSAQPFLVMTDGAFVALVFVLSNLVDWLVSLISPLAYLPPAFTQNSGWRRFYYLHTTIMPRQLQDHIDDLPLQLPALHQRKTYVLVSLPHPPSPADPTPNHEPQASEPYEQYNQGDCRSLATFPTYQHGNPSLLSTHFVPAPLSLQV